MVQYSITPWRHASDLLAIRSAFYPFGDPSSPHSINQTAQLAQNQSHIQQLNSAKSRAISLVSLYISRGNCPHLLASTSLLISASLLDSQSLSSASASGSENSYGTQNRQGDALKCAYAAAFGRFVTGLLDGYQSKKHKMSMYAIAKQIGLPSTFVELRHQCTHEELPSIARLRKAVQDSLIWLWSGYWADLGPWDESQSALARARRGSELHIGGVRVGMMVSEQLAERMNVVDEIEREDEEARYWALEKELGDESSLQKVMERYLFWRSDEHENSDQHMQMVYSRRLISETTEDKLQALEVLRDSGDSTLMLASMKLFREIMNGEADTQIFAESGEDEEEEDLDITRDLTGRIDSDEVVPDDEDEDQHENKRQRMMEEEEDREEGWKMWEGPWIPKPIGIVREEEAGDAKLQAKGPKTIELISRAAGKRLPESPARKALPQTASAPSPATCNELISWTPCNLTLLVDTIAAYSFDPSYISHSPTTRFRPGVWRMAESEFPPWFREKGRVSRVFEKLRNRYSCGEKVLTAEVGVVWDQEWKMCEGTEEAWRGMGKIRGVQVDMARNKVFEFRPQFHIIARALSHGGEQPAEPQ